MVSNILVTGPPGIGKTTFVEKVLKKLQPSSGGFYTQEIRDGGRRVGFRLITLDGREEVLAHISIDSPYRVGKYHVNVDGLRKVGVSAVREALEKDDIIVIDEIGKMELCLPQFEQVVDKSLNSNKIFLATIGKVNNSYIDGIKKRRDIFLLELALANRDEFVDEVAQMINN